VADIKFYDYSPQVKAAIDGIATAWLHETARAVESNAKRNTSTEGWTNAERTSLRDSYSHNVDEASKTAQVGNTLEQAYWEEFGTGSHADTAKNGGRQGRSDWWVYIPDQEPRDKESTHYRDETEAKAAAAMIKEVYGKTAYATNSREPNYTLEKAFTAVSPKAKRNLQQKLKGL
jgi:hypothetical protein